MKTTTNTTNRSARLLTATMKCLLPVMAAGALASCGTDAIAISQSEPVFVPSAVPVRIWHSPSAELPRGVADDEPTNGWEGMWGGTPIEFGDVQDAEELIPVVRFVMPL